MKTLIALAAAALSLLAVPASAAISFTFTPGNDTAGSGYSPTTGYTVVNDFNEASDLAVISGSGYNLHAAGTDPNNAEPAFPSLTGSPYLSVNAGGVANVNFAQNFQGSFQFDWGSVDDYNTLTLHRLVGGDLAITPGTPLFPNPANGNQGSSSTNGVFTLFTGGETITGLTLTSSTNSFEIDNFAVLSDGVNPLIPGGGAVPEPATWAMMIMGFGAAGAVLRRRRTVLA